LSLDYFNLFFDEFLNLDETLQLLYEAGDISLVHPASDLEGPPAARGARDDAVAELCGVCTERRTDRDRPPGRAIRSRS
jgi:hypothetical protein